MKIIGYIALAILGIALIGSSAQAQVIKGKVMHAQTGKPVRNVHVSLPSHVGITAISGVDGIFYVDAGSEEVSLHFSHVAFEEEEVHLLVKKDTIYREFKLVPKVYQLNDFTTSAKYKPEPVFHSFVHYVHDFEVLEDRLVLITFSRNLRKDPKLTLSALDETILHEIDIPIRPEALFRDYQGRIFLEYENTSFLVQHENDQLRLIQVNDAEYQARVKPCNDTIGPQILFSDQLWYLPSFNYYSFHTHDSLFRLLRHIVDPQVNHMMRWEYYDMIIDDQRKAREMAEFFPNIDKQEMAGLMSGFQHSIYYEEPYAPLFVVQDTIHIFDHYSNYLYRYGPNLLPVDSQEISYHIPPKRRQWKKKVYLDRLKGDFFGLFEVKGYAYLKKINCQNGSFDYSVKLANQFVEKIRVHNQYAYYLHKPPNSPEKPTIFRERLAQR